MDVIEKIKKLLAMAERGTEHEAVIAAAKAQTLLMQHNIDLSQVSTGDTEADDKVQQWLLETMNRRQIWKGNLASAIAQANFCHVWWLGSDIQLIGKEHNVQIARHLYSYLVEAVLRVTRQARAVEKERYKDALHQFRDRVWTNSFRLGCTHRLCDRLLEQKARLKTEGIPEAKVSALSCIEAYQRESAAITQWMIDQGIKTGRKVKSQAKAIRSGYSAGKAAADSINLSRQLSGMCSNRILQG